MIKEQKNVKDAFTMVKDMEECRLSQMIILRELDTITTNERV